MYNMQANLGIFDALPDAFRPVRVSTVVKRRSTRDGRLLPGGFPVGGASLPERRVVAHQERVHLGGGASALGDGPDHQRLPAAAIARREHTGHGRLELAKLRLEVGAVIRLQAELLG